jgi:uncharacterized protein YgbK (DUF1537 family)
MVLIFVHSIKKPSLASLLVIADDLTGAVEAGGLLARHDVSTAVIHDFETDLSSALEKCEHTAVVFNTESRHISAELAVRRVENAVRTAAAAGVANFFKKTDSTMRGNIGDELKAFMHSTGCRQLPFIPAHPAVNRFTREGHHYVGDVPLHHTSFAHDPLHPIQSSYIPDMENMQPGVPVHSVSVEDADAPGTLGGILVYDCGSLGDLHTIGRALRITSRHHIMAGSSAMVDLLPELLHLKKTSGIRDTPATPALLVNGSVNGVALTQVAYARDAGITTCTIPPELLAVHANTDSIPARNLLHRLAQGIAGEDMVILTSLDPKDPGPVDQSSGTIRETARSIGILADLCMREIPFRTLVVFGGDTLMGVVRAMGCQSILPGTELLPGVSSALAGTDLGKIHLISKPGGYGNQDIILKILKQLQR